MADKVPEYQYPKQVWVADKPNYQGFNSTEFQPNARGKIWNLELIQRKRGSFALNSRSVAHDSF